MAPTRSGAGYWVLTDDGRAHPYGDAGGGGPGPSFRPALPMVGIAGR